MPEKLRDFYLRVHNKFRIAGLGWTGLCAVDDLFTLDGEPEDYEVTADGHAKPSADALLPVFGSSWGNLCLGLGTGKAWHQDDGLLQPLGDFLPALDTGLVRFCSPIH